MERLKSILADKILDLSTEAGSDDIKVKLDKIHRFRDFANACKTLMAKYPAIEDELIEMVNDGDFDTKIASSRVDRIVRLSEESSASSQEPVAADSPVINPEDIPMAVYKGEEPDIVEKTLPYEDLVAEEPELVVSADSESEDNMFPSDEELAVLKRKTTVRRIVVVLAIALAVVIIIIIVKFVMLHWQTILIIAGIFVILAILLIWYMRKRK